MQATFGVINPFQSPQADLDDRSPNPPGKPEDGPTDLERRRRRGLPRETTLQALGVMKVASGVFFALGWLLLPLAVRFLPERVPAPLRFGELTVLTPTIVVSAAAGLVHLAIAGGLIQLRRWACWLQGFSSATGCLAGLYLMTKTDAQGNGAVTLFSGMLLLSMEAVSFYLVMSQPSARVTAPSYQKVIAETSHWRTGKIIAFKSALLATLWIADLAAVLLGLIATLS